MPQRDTPTCDSIKRDTRTRWETEFMPSGSCDVARPPRSKSSLHRTLPRIAPHCRAKRSFLPLCLSPSPSLSLSRGVHRTCTDPVPRGRSATSRRRARGAAGPAASGLGPAGQNKAACRGASRKVLRPHSRLTHLTLKPGDIRARDARVPVDRCRRTCVRRPRPPAGPPAA